MKGLSMRRHFLILTAAIALAVAVIAGCGDDGDSGSSSGSAAVNNQADNSGETGNAEAGNADGAESGGPAESGADGGSGAQVGSNAEFIEEANEICENGASQISIQSKPIFRKYGNVKGKAAQEAGYVELIEEVIVPAVEKEIEEIRALGLPAGDEQELEAIFAAMEEVLNQAQKDPTAFNDRVPFEKSERLAVEYGLGSCGGLTG
jgi:hypothetical protein